MLIEKIGTNAMLEQTAEECSELSQACLKLAREMRGENPTHKDYGVLLSNLCEELADVEICINELKNNCNINHDIWKWKQKKKKRIRERFN